MAGIPLLDLRPRRRSLILADTTPAMPCRCWACGCSSGSPLAFKKSSPTRGQIVMFVFFLSVADAAMHTTIARFVRGLLSIRHLGWIALQPEW